MLRKVTWLFIFLYSLVCLATFAGMLISAIGTGGTTYVYTDNPFALHNAPFFSGECAIFLMCVFVLEIGVALVLWMIGSKTRLGGMIPFPRRAGPDSQQD